jgi:large subunit ribosomal protein L21
MFAIVEIAGLQYKVEQDQKLFVNRLKGEKGDKVSFDKVLLTVNGSTTVGAPAVGGITVDIEILGHVQADKVIIFKKKRRKGYAKKNGHRQQLTQIIVTGITGFEAKKAEKKAAPKATETKAAKAEVAESGFSNDSDAVNFSEDHELNYHLKKNELSQTKENRETLITLGKELKAELGKEVLTHEDVDALIKANAEQFKEIKK